MARLPVPSVSDTDGTGRLAIFTVPSVPSVLSCFSETAEDVDDDPLLSCLLDLVNTDLCCVLAGGE